MGLIERILEKRDATAQTGANLAYPPLWLRNFILGIDNPSASGVNVNENTAVKMTAVFACVRLLADSVAMLNLPLYKRLKEGKQEAVEHPLYSILHDMANTEMTSFQFRQVMMINALLMPGAYAEIERNGAGQVIGLWPIPSNRVQIRREYDTGRLWYDVTLFNGSQKTLSSDDVFVISGMGFDTDKPFNPVNLAREAIGLGLATEGFGARFFGNGSNAGGIVEYPGKLSDEAFSRYKQSFREDHEGLGKSNRVMFLEEGMKFTQLTIPPESAQFLETRKFQVVEIARFFNVPPHMIMDFEGATFSNIEQKSLEFVTYSLMPWLVKWEQSIKKDLLSEKDRTKFYPKFRVQDLLRGDTAARQSFYHAMVQDGVFTADEVRELEDYNPQPNGVGKLCYQNGTMTPKGMTAAQYQAFLKGGESTNEQGNPNPDEQN